MFPSLSVATCRNSSAVLTRLVIALAEAGESRAASRFLRRGFLGARGTSDLARDLESVSGSLSVDECARLMREWERFVGIVRTPSQGETSLSLLRKSFGEVRVALRPSPSLLSRLELRFQGRPVPLGSVDREPKFFRFFELPRDQYARKIFDGTVFREYLRGRRIRPEEITRLVVENNRDSGTHKICYHLRLLRKGGQTVSVAMRVVADVRSKMPFSVMAEGDRIRTIASSPVAHLIPAHSASGVVQICANPPLAYKVFFGDWVEGETLWRIIHYHPRLGPRLAMEVVRTYAAAVRRCPSFMFADMHPVDIMVQRGAHGRPSFFFIDFGVGQLNPFDCVRHVVHEYVVEERLLKFDEVLPLLWDVPIFRRAFDHHLALYRRGTLLLRINPELPSHQAALEVELLERYARQMK